MTRTACRTCRGWGAAACGTLVLLGSAAPAQPPRHTPVPAAALEAHVRFLADDLLEGRGIGSRGGRLAALYIETVFRAAGLEPPSSSFRQPFTMHAFAPDPAASLAIEDGGKPLAADEDFVLRNMGLPEGSWRGEPLFVGYAIDAPEEHWDDLKGADLEGKLLVAFTNEPGRDDPARFRGRALTVHGRWTTKYALAARRGAAGMLLVHTDGDAGYGWDVVRNGWRSPTLALADGEPLLPLRGWITEGTAERLAAAAGTSLAALRDRAERADFRPFTLPVRLHLRARLAFQEVEGVNVVGVLPGRDRRAVVLSAHYDHLGFGEPVAGDAIINGAVDNGSALAVLLALAQAYAGEARETRPTLVFAAVDAEEEGFCGSIHYTRHPVVPLADTLANLNFEMANVWGPTRDLVAIGAEHSELADVVATVARQLGMRVAPDDAPEQGYFFRSDQFAFAQAGVPAVWLDGGTDVIGRPAGWGAEQRREYRRRHYHRPSDEVRPDWDFRGLVQLASVVQAVVDEISRRGVVRWRPDSPFAAVHRAGR